MFKKKLKMSVIINQIMIFINIFHIKIFHCYYVYVCGCVCVQYMVHQLIINKIFILCHKSSSKQNTNSYIFRNKYLIKILSKSDLPCVYLDPYRYIHKNTHHTYDTKDINLRSNTFSIYVECRYIFQFQLNIFPSSTSEQIFTSLFPPLTVKFRL